jgi:cobalt-zinc-cadmium efflux system outer membrane protein
MLFRLCACLLLPAALFAQSYTSLGDSQLGALIEDALERNPQVREAFADYQAALQRIPQVTTLPDPMLSVMQYARTPETRVGPQTTVVSLTQRFPWFGKLSDQGKIAAKQAAVHDEFYQARRSEIVRQVKLAYYDVGYIDRALVITRQDEELLAHYETLAEARYSQGVGLQQPVIKLQAEITRVLNRLQGLERQRVDAEATLNILRDRPASDPIAAVSLRRRPVPEIDAEQLLTIGRSERPEVKAAFLQIERNEKSIQLAQRQYWPDFSLGASWGNVLGRRDEAGRMNPPPGNGKDVYSVAVGVNIPIFRAKYDAGVQEASERFSAARHAYRSTVNNVELSIRTIGFRIQTIDDQIALFERALLPQAEEALSSTESAYSTGSIGVLDLLDGERMLLEVRLGLARLESDYMKSLAEMERSIGSAFPEERP